MLKSRNIFIDILLGLGLSYSVVMILFLIAKGVDFEVILKTSFLFLLLLAAPFFAIEKSMLILLGIGVWLFFVFIQVKYFRRYLPYFFALDFILWGLIGMKSMILVSGGA